MPHKGRPLSRSDVLDLLRRIGDDPTLAASGHRTVVIVGGAFMALAGLRDGTRDIDTVSRIDDTLRRRIAAVAELDGDLAPDFLNAAATAFAPQTSEDARSGQTIVDAPGLRVVVPSADFVFLMKLYAARPVPDFADMALLLAACRWTSVDAIVEAFYAAYPLENEDPYLASFVEERVRRAGLEARFGLST